MVGCFGLLEGPQARRAEFPRDRLVDVRVERGQQLDAWQFECETVLDPSCRPTREGNLWRCPGCGRHTRFLYTPEVECRTCLRLEYQSQHRNHALPDIPRLKRLRRLIGASAEFFTPLPRMPCKLSPQQRARFRDNRAEIRAIEAELVTHLTKLNDTLDRRIRSRKRLYRW